MDLHMVAAWAGLAAGRPPADWPAFTAAAPVLRVFQSAAGPATQSAAAWREAACAFWWRTCPDPFDDGCAPNAT